MQVSIMQENHDEGEFTGNMATIQEILRKETI
jgi:hypothetical protein